MSFVKIDVPGYEAFEGNLGMVPFKNGISTRELTAIEKIRLGAVLKIVELDNDKQVGAATVMATGRKMTAEVKPALVRATEEPKPIVYKHSRDFLEKLAETGGIKAVRDVAKEYEVKGVEISKMIDEIIAKQEGKD